MTEKSEELEALLDLEKSAKQDFARMKSLHAKGKLANNIVEETISTVMPLLLDLIGGVVKYAEAVDEWSEGVDEVLEQGAEHGPALDEEEAQLLDWLLVRFQEFLTAAGSAPGVAKETGKSLLEIEVKLKMARQILSKFLEVADVEEESELEEVEGGEDSSEDDAGTDDE